MQRILKKSAAASMLMLIAALLICLLPKSALADANAVEGGSGALYDTLRDAISAGETAMDVTGNTAGYSIPGNCAVTVKSSGSMDFGGCTLEGALTVESGGTLSGSYFYNNGSFSGNFSGAIYIPVPSALSGASTLFTNGNFSDTVSVSNGYYDSAATITGAIVGGYYYDVSGSSLTPKTYFIAYYYGDGKGTAMDLGGSYPKYYIASTSALTIPAAPDQTGYTFSYWAYNGTDSGKTFRIAAGTMENITLYSYWNKASGAPSGGAGGMTAGSAISGGGGGGGGMSGAAGALVAGTTTDDDDEDDTVAAASTSPQGGMRIRNASSTTRHTFDKTDGEVEARANARKRASFPWQWVGVGLGGALLLFAGGMTLRRKLRERNAATLEKLHIYD